jgi:hypothetical protein
VPAPAAIVAAQTARHAAHNRRRIIAGGAAALALAFLVPMTAIVIAVGGTRDPADAAHTGPSAAALAEIP